MNKSDNFLDKYGFWIGMLLFAVPLLFFGYYRIQYAFYFFSTFTPHFEMVGYGRKGLLYIALGLIIMIVLCISAILKERNKKQNEK